jgi:hypothetical protein
MCAGSAGCDAVHTWPLLLAVMFVLLCETCMLE